MTDFTEPWTPNFGEDEEPSIESAVYQAIGTGSTCWDDLTQAGVFHSEKAKWAGDGLLRFLSDWLVLGDEAALRAEIVRLREALAFYADPDTYFAVDFMFDRPCGGFDEDFDEEHGNSFYQREMPGRTAREALGRSVGASDD